MQQRHKELRLKGVAVFWNQEDIWQDLRENDRAEHREVNDWIFCQDSKK
jgi:hypothetical protein